MTFRRGVPGDDLVLGDIDGSFVTDTIFEVRLSANGFTLNEKSVSSPIVKKFPLSEDIDVDDEEASARFVAVDADGNACGFIDLVFEVWNRRVVIADLGLSPQYRRRGLGRELVGLAADYGRELNARTLWLEVTNINAPAIRAYLRMGFKFCGLDTSLYRGTASEGEVAVFMSQDLPG
ncbi:GNAT family N-acetyltransferase [Arthrobacter sp. BL-252-APC-1A]|nr:GNAT family N-acetyltransferase [Arthrobacter sp. BL-252-APC-1A]